MAARTEWDGAARGARVGCAGGQGAGQGCRSYRSDVNPAGRGGVEQVRLEQHRNTVQAVLPGRFNIEIRASAAPGTILLGSVANSLVGGRDSNRSGKLRISCSSWHVIEGARLICKNHLFHSTTRLLMTCAGQLLFDAKLRALGGKMLQRESETAVVVPGKNPSQHS